MNRIGEEDMSRMYLVLRSRIFVLVQAGLALPAFLICTLTAYAERQVVYEHAPVVESIPIVKHVRVSTPREECWQQEVSYRRGHRQTGVSTVVGALVGGAIGNAVGHHKKNKQVGAVLGAVLGGTVGHAVGSKNQPVVNNSEEVCRVYQDSYQEERIIGYRVQYQFNNRIYTTRTRTDPGESIKLRLAISPVAS